MSKLHVFSVYFWIGYTFTFTETPRNKQRLELAALKAGKSISKDETKSLVMSMGHRLTAVIVRKGSATK